eukprot:TRINITY_DN497_c1_g1_i1.p1 TRINITY_DN497_c1_g1~~TRINITY_DN497_c1_g1_i1.p1  ORF type:complete len:155 (+),score=20.81 TRINITY_DN497_c1_g1_i1:96-560(+)
MSTCAACNQSIDSGAASIADKKYHQDCLKCVTCSKNFLRDGIGSPFPRPDGTFECGSCRHGQCGKCGNIITSAVMTYEGVSYHKECYDEVRANDKCLVCGENITGYTITFEGQVYHKECYENAAPDCAICKQKIVGTRTILEGNNYHPECYEKK